MRSLSRKLLKRTIADVFSKGQEEHLTEIIEAIAKNTNA
jgi:hypothetical protein